MEVKTGKADGFSPSTPSSCPLVLPSRGFSQDKVFMIWTELPFKNKKKTFQWHLLSLSRFLVLCFYDIYAPSTSLHFLFSLFRSPTNLLICPLWSSYLLSCCLFVAAVWHLEIMCLCAVLSPETLPRVWAWCARHQGWTEEIVESLVRKKRL